MRVKHSYGPVKPPRRVGIAASRDITEDGGLPPAWTPHKYHAEQTSLWTSKSRFAIVPAGRGSGKTELAKRRLICYLPIKKEWSDPRYAYCAPTYAQAKRIAWQHLLRLCPKEWVYEIDRSELCIRTVFGSELWVVGLDAPQRIEGVQWDGIVVDESSDIKPKTFELTILPALSWRNGWCWRIGVPKRYGIGAAEFKRTFDKARKHELPDTEAFTWSAEGILPKRTLNKIKSLVDMKDYQEQIGGVFVSAAGGIFYNFNEDYNIRPCPYRPDKPIIIGSDFNVDPMAWVLCHRLGDGDLDNDILEVFDELWLRDANTQGTLNILYNKYRTHKGGFEFYGDATSRARKTAASASDFAIIKNDKRFLDLGRTVHYLRSNPPKADRFAACNGLVLNANGTRRLYVDPHCKHLIEDRKSVV